MALLFEKEVDTMPKVKDLGITVVPEQFGPMEIGPGTACNPTQCSDCTMQQFSICGTTPGTGCSDCTRVPFSICGTTPGQCSDCTMVPFSICGTTPGPGRIACTDWSFCMGVSYPHPACGAMSRNPWTACGGTMATPCGGSWDPWQRGGGLTPQVIGQMRQQLQAQLAA